MDVNVGYGRSLSSLLVTNYLPYAKTTIITRAIPAIDGLKPVQRRLLYTMWGLGLLKGEGKMKSHKISGATMSYHPHGDSSIYETLVLLTDKHDGINVPYINGKGSFGRQFSRDLKYSAARYTEAKLAPICAEMFKGIKENAVDFVDTFDASDKEPTLLPVKFPNILVNSNAGVAVGTSSNIPSFSLINVCRATQGIIKGTITNAGELAAVLGAPEFTTGGFLHCSEKSLTKLCETGKGSFVISGKVELYNDRIVINEIPYCTTAEDIMEAIDKNIKEKKLKGIRDVDDEIGLKGLRLVVWITKGYKPREILQDLCRLTPLRSTISYRTRVILNNRCKEMGLNELLESWIEFRAECISRATQYNLDKDNAKKHLLDAWELIKVDLDSVIKIIRNNKEVEAKKLLMKQFKLDELQAEYILELKLRAITQDRAEAAFLEGQKLAENIAGYSKIIADDKVRKQIIVDELEEIINKYGTKNRTTQVEEIKEEEMKGAPVKISDANVCVVLTKNGFLKRLVSTKDLMDTFEAKNGDYEVQRWGVKNNSHILVFDRFGSVHKILVDSIDASNKSVLTDKVNELAGLEKMSDVVYIDAAGDYSGYFNLVYPNGRGTRVYYAKIAGSRSIYKSLYDELTPGQYWITKETKFFMLTLRKKAAYCDLSLLGMFSNRAAFKVARLSKSDVYTELLPYDDVPNKDFIDLNKYNKDYTVSIGDDILKPIEGLEERVKASMQNKLKEFEENKEAYEEKMRLEEEEARRKEEEKQNALN